MNKAERTRQFIVEKTAPIFNVKGYSGTSLNDITGATGLTKGSVYGNFANKDEVAMAAFDHNWQKVQDIVSAEMMRHQSVRDQLLVYVSVFDNFLKSPFPAGGCPILNTATEADDTHKHLKKKAADAISSWKNQIMKLIKKGMDSGEFVQHINAEQIALTIIAMIEGGIMITKLTGKTNSKKAILRSVEKLINDLA